MSLKPSDLGHDLLLGDGVVVGRDALNVVKVLDAMEISLREGGRPVKTAEL